MMEVVRYRVGQFMRALSTQVPTKEVEQATTVLPPEARELFRRQSRQDQRHALAVYHALRRTGHTDPRLLAAALLHDAGKAAARLPAWQRAVIVLLNHLAPRLLARLGQGGPQDRVQSLTQGDVLSLTQGDVLNRPKGYALSLSKGYALSLSKGWRRPFVVHNQHAEVGARWAQEAGCSPLTVVLIRRHQDRLTSCTSEEDRLLAALQAADGQD